MGQLGQISGGSGPGVCVWGGGRGLWVPAESIVKKSSCADPEIFARADKKSSYKVFFFSPQQLILLKSNG